MARSVVVETNRKSELPPDEIKKSRQDEPQAEEAERIARRAYERFEARGGEHGRDQEDWFAAEQEVRRRRGR
jgi:hypothetical protein